MPRERGRKVSQACGHLMSGRKRIQRTVELAWQHDAIRLINSYCWSGNKADKRAGGTAACFFLRAEHDAAPGSVFDAAIDAAWRALGPRWSRHHLTGHAELGVGIV